MTYRLSDVLREIGTISVPSRKGEVEFAYDENEGELHVIYKEHNPDGTYTGPDVWTFQID